MFHSYISYVGLPEGNMLVLLQSLSSTSRWVMSMSIDEHGKLEAIATVKHQIDKSLVASTLW